MRAPTWYYVDTSTYLKLYFQEKDSRQAIRFLQNKALLSSALLRVECFSALSRKRTSGKLSEGAFASLSKQIKIALEYLETMNLADEILERAEQLSLDYSARAPDAIHVASALIFREKSNMSIMFITSDKKQKSVADCQGLKTYFVG